jgi:hypothetical protein
MLKSMQCLILWRVGCTVTLPPGVDVVGDAG